MAKIIRGGKGGFALKVKGIAGVYKNLELTKHQEAAIKDFLEIEAQELIENAHRYIRLYHSRWQEHSNNKTDFVRSKKLAIKDIFHLIKYILNKSILL